jgi:excisionase family DNA binding protein
MTSVALRQETYLPGDDNDVDAVSQFLDTHGDAGRGQPEFRYFLAGSDPDDKVELPPAIYHAVRQVVEALQQGHAVTVAPVTQTLTTQQAADLLGVSRPTVIKLLNEGKIPYERTGNNRRILLRDLLAYRKHRRDEQYAALEATSVPLDDESGVEETLRELRETRRAVASRRKQRGDL